jgi:hypothetical protein
MNKRKYIPMEYPPKRLLEKQQGDHDPKEGKSKGGACVI